MTDATRLPRGRHSLSREEVVASQRGRILRGMAETMAEKGYVATTVADVLREAGVSRETFYQQFDSKADCFMTAYDAAATIVLARMQAAPSDLDGALRAYLEAIASEPAFARVFLLEVYAAGPEALARREVIQTRFAERVGVVLGTDDRFVCEALVAAVSAMVTARLAADDLPGLLALREPLVSLALRLV